MPVKINSRLSIDVCVHLKFTSVPITAGKGHFGCAAGPAGVSAKLLSNGGPQGVLMEGGGCHCSQVTPLPLRFRARLDVFQKVAETSPSSKGESALNLSPHIELLRQSRRAAFLGRGGQGLCSLSPVATAGPRKFVRLSAGGWLAASPKPWGAGSVPTLALQPPELAGQGSFRSLPRTRLTRATAPSPGTWSSAVAAPLPPQPHTLSPGWS